MRKLSVLAVLAASALASLVACRDSSSGDDTVTPDSSNGDMTIQQVQDPAMPNGTPVTLKGVVVTAVDRYGGDQGDFWVEEPGGGEFSGIHVFGGPLEQVNALKIGDVVDITGAQKEDFHYNGGSNGSGGFQDGYAITELKPLGAMNVSVVSSGSPITPDVVDANAISQITDYMARDAEWEKWEGVLIKVSTVAATSSDKCVGSMCKDPTLHSFGVTGDILVESGLAAMPTTAAKLGDCFASVTGVVDYFFDYQILPRTTDEIVTGGTGCTGSVTHATIEQVRTGAATGIVSLDDVYVSAVSYNKKNFWISQSLTAAGNQGVYVMRCSSSSSCSNTAVLDAAIVPGAKVTVLGKATEFNAGNAANGSITEILNPTTTVTAAPTGTVTPVTGQAVSSLLTETTGEAYEGVLVTLTNVKVATIGTSGTFFVSDLAQYPGNNAAAVAFKAPGDMYTFKAADMDACYASITGIWTYTPFDKRYQFLPTAAGTGTGTCN